MSINYTKLLASILPDEDRFEGRFQIDSERIQVLALKQDSPTKEEQAQLFLSPKLLKKLVKIRKKSIDQNIAKISRYHNLTILPLAAATASQDELVIKNDSFTVCVYRRKSKLGDLVQLIVQPALRRRIRSGVEVRLVDSGGLEWIHGTLDENGEIISLWTNKEIDLIDRASQHTISFELI